MDGAPLRTIRRSMSPTSRSSDDAARQPLRTSRDGRTEGDDDVELDEDELEEFLNGETVRHARTRLFAAFLIFGLLNNVLYVIILSAALDLVPASTPKGLVALFNIFPALLTKVLWPLLSSGQIQYKRRVLFCTACSWLGIITIAFSTGLGARLFGISLASLSSGLGELTFLQLTTTLPSRLASKTALGAWSSGTGAAGIAGAGLWWLLRGLGVKGGLGISSVLPLFFPITYFILLPPFGAFTLSTGASAAYQPIPTSITPEAITPGLVLSIPDTDAAGTKYVKVYLTTQDKFRLLRPLVLRYMLPLFAVYVEEYVINSGVAPTLVFPLPTSGIWSRLFKSPRDYYPFWSLTYQTFVFLSRSSLSLGLPALPLRLLPLPATIQLLILTLLSLQSSRFIFATDAYTPPGPTPPSGVDRSIGIVFVLICLEGLCGGSAYVNTFYHVGREGDFEDPGEGEPGRGGGGDEDEVRRGMEREFRIGAVGAADSCGILFASLISMPTEVALCNAQVAAGRTTCRDL